MNKAEKELFAMFVAELMGNKMLIDDLWDETIHWKPAKMLGEFQINGGEGRARGPIFYDPSKCDPPERVRNVLEKTDELRRKK